MPLNIIHVVVGGAGAASTQPPHHGVTKVGNGACGCADVLVGQTEAVALAGRLRASEAALLLVVDIFFASMVRKSSQSGEIYNTVQPFMTTDVYMVGGSC